MKRIAPVLIVFALIGLAFSTNGEDNHTFKSKAGYVPDAETAIAIAVAVWNPIYGKEKIRREAPYNAALSQEVWTITGSLPEKMVGGVAVVEISKNDGRILRMSHGK